MPANKRIHGKINPIQEGRVTAHVTLFGRKGNISERARASIRLVSKIAERPIGSAGSVRADHVSTAKPSRELLHALNYYLPRTTAQLRDC